MWFAYIVMSIASLGAFFYGMSREKNRLWLSFTFAAACVSAMSGVMAMSVMEEARRAVGAYNNELMATIVLCLLFAGLSDRLEIERNR